MGVSILSSVSASVAVELDDLPEAASVAFLTAESGFEERIDDFGCRRDPDDPRPEGEHVHVIVLHGLVRGVMVVDHGASHARDLVCSNRRASSGTADHDASFGIAADDRPTNGRGNVRIVDGIEGVGPDVDDGVARTLEVGMQVSFEGEPCMVCSDDDSHDALRSLVGRMAM